jgi:hypothetical protein
MYDIKWNLINTECVNRSGRKPVQDRVKIADVTIKFFLLLAYRMYVILTANKELIKKV